MDNRSWTSFFFNQALKSAKDSAMALANDAQIAANRAYGSMWPQDNPTGHARASTQLRVNEHGRQRNELIRLRNEVRKAQLALEVAHREAKETAQRSDITKEARIQEAKNLAFLAFKVRICETIFVLQQEAEALESSSAIAKRFYESTIATKYKKMDALSVLIHPVDMEGLITAALRQHANPEVIQGLHSETCKLLNEIIHYQVTAAEVSEPPRPSARSGNIIW